MEFTCECCHYSTMFKSNYVKHLSSNKHIIHKYKQTPAFKCDVTKASPELAEVSQKLAEVSQKLAEVSPKVGIFCKYCEKEYKHKSSLSKHIKYSCTKNKDEDLKELVRLMNLKMEAMRKELQSENKELQKQLDQKSKQIEKLMGKLEIHGSFNNNTINNITLLAYRNTDVSHLTTEDYIGFYKKVNHCVKTLIEKIHFNPEKPENMNIYISNMKDKYMTIYDGQNWNLANKNIEMQRLYEEKEQMLEEWLESNPNPLLKEKFARYLSNKGSDDCLQHIMEEIKLMMYNKTRSWPREPLGSAPIQFVGSALE
jgi:hypothetical protein